MNATRQVAAALMAAPAVRHHGYDLSRASGVRSGRMYPVLAEMLERGWLSDGWEEPSEAGLRRRYYEVTPAGRRAMAEMLEMIEP